MTGKYRQGFGKAERTQRRVDVGSGRLVTPVDTRTHARTRDARSIGNLDKTKAVLAVVFLAAAILALSGCASQIGEAPAVSATEPVAAVVNSIAIESIRLTAKGHYLDLRYRVLDAERANQVLGPGVKPLLIDEASGMVMEVPTTAKLGSLRQTRGIQKPDRTYFVLFANTAGLSSGSKVTAEIGDMRFESLTIE